MSPQVTRVIRGPGPDFVWQVAPLKDTVDFVAKLLEIHDKHVARQWKESNMEERMQHTSSPDDAVVSTPASDMALTHDFAQEAWAELVDWMDQQGMLEGRVKNRRRHAAAAVCHTKVGDKRVAMWILRFGSHQRAVEFLEQQRAAKILEEPQGSAEALEAR